MVRNLILSNYAGRPLAEQEAIYRRVWLEPFEKVLGNRMDEMLELFLVVQFGETETESSKLAAINEE